MSNLLVNKSSMQKLFLYYDLPDYFFIIELVMVYGSNFHIFDNA